MPSFVLRRGPKAGLAQPQALTSRAPAPRAVAAPIIAVPEMVGRSCRLEGYTPKKISTVKLPAGTDVIAYASPDSTFAVTKKLMDAAKSSILIGIYDFSAPHMHTVLTNALARGVKISLMLDIDSKSESDLFDELVEMGVRGVSAPSCANEHVRVFSSSHEKVIVIDKEWCLVQSGNYSDNSIPLNEVDGGQDGRFRTGNRDTGLAIRSKPLAALYAKILESDMALVDAAPEMLRQPIEDAVFLVERAPKGPTQRFKSAQFDLAKQLTVTPVLSPDNYMSVVPPLLAKAKSSILIEQQYIRGSQPLIRKLLGAIAKAKANAPDLDVRIVLGKIFNASDLKKENENLKILAKDFGLKLGTNIRYVNTDQFVHCHNKMILIDGKGVLVSSQNWSDSAVSKNREAGVWLQNEAIADYFTKIFEYDWKVAFKQPGAGAAQPQMLAPKDLSVGGFIRVERADYEEV